MSDLREQLRAIYTQRGRLTPADVLDEAADGNHPLHSRFEWDDSVAGPRWRRHQAHELIRSVRISYRADDGGPAELRAFHAVRREDGYRYEPVEEVIRDEVTTKILMADMEREWRLLKRRYDRFEAFRAMIQRDLDAA